MNTILTKNERPKLPPARYSRWNCSNGNLAFSDEQMEAYADAREAAVLSKLAQQADRQRVRDEPDWRHPRIQALIGADARNRICIDLVWRILENPRREFTAGDMEYWDKLHDKVREVALAAAPEAPAQADDDHLEQHLEMAPAQASEVDERAAFEAWALREYATVRREHGELRWDSPSVGAAVEHALSWWQARAALAQKGGK